MLPAPLEQIDETLLQRVVAEHWSESQQIDFKVKSYEPNDDGRSELRKDVCAFANQDGGDLVLGIAEVAGKASALRPLSLGNPDQELRRLVGTLDNEVEPKIQGAKARAIALSEGGFAIVIRVPKSYIGPHRCGPSVAHRFVVRNNTMTNDMSYEQVRSAFLATSTLYDKSSVFVARRLSELEELQGPRRIRHQAMLAVHLVPFQGLARQINLNIPAVRNDSNIMRVGDAMNWRRRPNLHGIALYEDDTDATIDEYVQIYRDGCVEYVRGVQLHSQFMRTISAEWIAAGLRDCIQAYHSTAQIWGLGGPVVISASLLHCSGVKLHDGRRHRPYDYESRYARMDLGDTLVDDIAGAIELDALALPSLDVLFQAFEQPRCTFYDANGKWIHGR